jgi:hypothetical protein
VLAKLRQLDGEGSELDAERLGGLKASEFARAEGPVLHEPLPPYDCDEFVTSHWSAYPGNFGYYRDQSGFVHLEGIAFLCGEEHPKVFTLPPGYRPFGDVSESGFLNSNPTRIEITSGGDVNVPASHREESASVSGISFRCAPSGQNGCP